MQFGAPPQHGERVPAFCPVLGVSPPTSCLAAPSPPPSSKHLHRAGLGQRVTLGHPPLICGVRTEQDLTPEVEGRTVKPSMVKGPRGWTCVLLPGTQPRTPVISSR